ncbi:YheC/YheD family protein [Bacillus sp. CGMCC 1.16607]|uniref:YheC/YheD family endospore coat-associated protein n=1 Tax=Bacillus sp. CGMCC 1.16607 TaxID=3351842 RepID=UPI003632EF77
MEAFGIITLNENSEMAYFTEIAIRASELGMTCCRFIPSNIHPVSQQISGSIYDPHTKKWAATEFPIPTILYDRCFYGDDFQSKQCSSIVSWLKGREDIVFLGYGLPNKLELNHVLKQSVLSPYLPLTQSITNLSVVLEELNQFKRIVIKPINGSQGNGIYYIEYETLPIKVKTFNKNRHIQKEFHDEKKFHTWISTLISKKNYLVQPYLELSNENNQPFDIRILLQKCEDGSWMERGRGIRVGHPDGIISNLHAGGQTESYGLWKQKLSPNQKEFIDLEINELLREIPKVLEEKFLPLFELGIDVGMAKDGSIWVLDINSKPGRKVILETTPENRDDLFFAPILYGRTLDSSGQNGRKRYDAKTLSY